MNNDLQSQLATALGMDTTASEGNGTNAQTTQDPNNTGATQTSEATQETNPNSNESTTQVTQPSSTEDNSTIRQMREQISKHKSELERSNNLLKRLAEERGITVEQLEEDLKAKEDKAKAQSMNISPEVAKQIRLQEERIQQLEQQAIQEDLMHRVTAFKKETGLDDQQTLQFLRDASAKGLNPIAKGTDLLILYRAMNFDTLSKAREAEIRQQILNEMQQQRESSNSVTGTTGTTAPASQQTSESSPEILMKDLLSKLK